MAKEAGNNIKKLNKSINDLSKNKVFSRLDKDLKNQVTSFHKMNRVLSELQEKVAKAFSDKNIKLNIKDIKKFVDEANSLSNDLKLDFKLDSKAIVKNVREQRNSCLVLLRDRSMVRLISFLVRQ